MANKLLALVFVVALVARASAIAVWDQCGGETFEAVDDDTTCDEGNTCVRVDMWYSQCQPTADDPTLVPIGQQCGGDGYDGETTCDTGLTCVYYNENYSQCENAPFAATDDTTPAPATDAPPTEETTQAPEETTAAPEETTAAPEETTAAPTDAPISTTEAPLRRLPLKEEQPVNDAHVHHETDETPRVAIWAQCGGKNYDGHTVCAEGLECHRVDFWYSQCRPINATTTENTNTNTNVGEPALDLSRQGQQCGGIGFEGSTECDARTRCVAYSDWYSQCELIPESELNAVADVPDTPEPISRDETIQSVQFVKKGHKCGGKGHTGPTTCEPGLVCTYKNVRVSRCQKRRH